MEHLIEEVLVDYVNFIEGYKNLIKTESINEESLYGNSGEIGDYKFHYHGAGCRLEKGGVVCEFDFLPENGFPIKFSNWKISEFINTNEKWNQLNYSLEDIHIALMGLVDKNKLFLLELGGVKFPVFQIKDVETLRV